MTNPLWWMIQAHLVDAFACGLLGDADTAARAELAQPRSSYASLISEILTLLGHAPITQPSRASPAPVLQPLSASELRTLRYLPNLSVPEIAPELYLSKNTVKTHISLLYDKLGVHRCWEAVERGRALGLVASSSRPS